MARLTEVTVAGAPAQVDGTIKPTRFASSTARARLGELVGQLRANPTQDWSADYTLGPVLGEGGMAVVRLAEQRSLGRQVAVKTPRGESSAAHDEALLREAWVTGAVEHPNVVPVHALGASRAWCSSASRALRGRSSSRGPSCCGSASAPPTRWSGISACYSRSVEPCILRIAAELSIAM